MINALGILQMISVTSRRMVTWQQFVYPHRDLTKRFAYLFKLLFGSQSFGIGIAQRSP